MSRPGNSLAADRASGAGGFACQIVADLDEVAVWIADVDAADGTGSAGTRDRAFLDGHAVGGQVRAHRGQRQISALPGMGCAALGSNSCPAWYRLIFALPNRSAPPARERHCA